MIGYNQHNERDHLTNAAPHMRQTQYQILH